MSNKLDFTHHRTSISHCSMNAREWKRDQVSNASLFTGIDAHNAALSSEQRNTDAAVYHLKH
ncbi:hypothetical protein [Vibrio coralliilyticus]|uniref:hypothetical protein n=1 Tax=Vibrio coralliilyticus TaxID=190893 RepID=UPI0015605A23|nr:hypothetical protein [Vibrio coralliilyticus]NRF63694.1 hypothetical protein [Vibrio coralliilyticus]